MPNLNPSLGASDSDFRTEAFKKDFSNIKTLFDANVIHRALVMDVDRQGGLWRINRGTTMNDMVSVDGTLKVRLLKNTYNSSDGLQIEAELDVDEYYALPLLGHNRMRYPRSGSVVKVLFDKPFDGGTNSSTLYWIGEDTYFANRDYETTFKFRSAEHGKEMILDSKTIWGGERPAVVGIDRDIKPDPHYEPFPEIVRKKSEDIVDTGSSNTRIQHSFSAHQDDDKRGYIEVGTEFDYIENMEVLTDFDFNTASADEIQQHQTMVVNHIKKFRDADMTASNWEFLVCKGSRIIVSTSLNTDARLISPVYSFDQTGQYGNINLSFDINYRDEGQGQTTNANGEIVGNEIQQQPINDSLNFNTQVDDITQVKANARSAISFDESIATLFLESKKIQILSRDGGDIAHLPLGEPLVRWLMRLLMVILHQERTIDIMRNRLYMLIEDFSSHFHGLAGATMTMQPEGSTNVQSFLKYLEIYEPSVGSQSIGGDDSSDFSEQGSDQGASTTIKDRIQEERQQLETLIQQLSSLLSTTTSIN